jgi:hypothetical protein
MPRAKPITSASSVVPNWGGLNTKLHALTDDDSLPAKVVSKPGQTHISRVTGLLFDNRKCAMVLGGTCL